MHQLSLSLVASLVAMNDVAAALTRIEAGIRRLELHTVLAALRDGVAPRVTHARLASLELASNPHLEALYAWRDGTRTGSGATLGEIWLIPGFYLLSLDDAIANYRAFAADPRWRFGWLPLFADGGGDFYVVELGREQSGAVRRFRIDEAEHPIEFATVGDFLGTLAAAFDEGVFLAFDEGGVDMNDELFARLARRLNPDVSRWRT